MKRFSLEEANSLLPELQRKILHAIQEMAPFEEALEEANRVLLEREWKMREAREHQAPRVSMLELQADWDEAAAHLVATREHLDQLSKHWTTALKRLGVIVRDVRRGVIDLPASDGRAYCWTFGEEAIAYWHDEDDHVDEARRSINEPA